MNHIKIENIYYYMVHIYYKHRFPTLTKNSPQFGQKIMSFAVLETIQEEKEYEEMLDSTFSEEKIKNEAKKQVEQSFFSDNENDPNYRKGMDRATIRILKSFCKERENLLIINMNNNLTNIVTIMSRIMFKFANAKAELARLATYIETIDLLLQNFPTIPFTMSCIHTDPKSTDKNSQPTIEDDAKWNIMTVAERWESCRFILTNYVKKIYQTTNQYYLSINEIISTHSSLTNFILQPMVLVKFLETIKNKLCQEMITLFKSRPITNINTEFMTKFNQIYDVRKILFNLLLEINSQ